MIPSELRKRAREILHGNWGKGACITLAYLLITLIINYILAAFKDNAIAYTILYIAEILITLPLSFGLIVCFLKISRSQETKAFSFCSEGFSRFSRVWKVFFQVIVRMILPIVCLIFVMFLMILLTIISLKSWIFILIGVALYIACIVYVVSRGLLYSLAYYIAYDEPTLSAKECVLKSENLMTGNRGNIFLLELSFIGWAILAAIPFGLGYIWLIPYIQVSLACFYEKVTNVKSKEVSGSIEIEAEKKQESAE